MTLTGGGSSSKDMKDEIDAICREEEKSVSQPRIPIMKLKLTQERQTNSLDPLWRLRSGIDGHFTAVCNMYTGDYTAPENLEEEMLKAGC